MGIARQIARLFVTVIGGIAALVFFLANPFSGDQGVAFLVSIPIFVVCGGLLVWLKNEESVDDSQRAPQRSAGDRENRSCS